MARADRQELVDRFEQFYRSYYREEIGELAQNYPSEQRSLYVDWNDLFTFDQDLADDYLSQPEQLREYAEEALRLYDLPVDVSLGQAHVRVQNLPESTAIRDIRSRHVNTLISVSGIVRKATSVRPKIQEAAFECQRCGTLSRIPQSGGDFQEPHECQGCERQGPFTINFDQSEFVDSQQLRIQESPEGLRGGQTPENIDVHIEDDLTGEVSPGDHVTATGVLHLEQQGSNNEQSAVFDVYMDGVSVQLDDEEFEEMDIDEADKRAIIERSGEDDIYEQMVESMAPSIYGFDDEKLAIILQLFSGVTKHLPDGSRTRGDLHVLLIGDPGTGKCLKGDTKVTLADGSEREIRELVEDHLEDPTLVDDGVYDEVDFEVPSMDADGRMTTRTATKVWKREAPERMYRIETASGHSVEVTPSHPLFVQRDGQPTPIEADELEGNEFIATPRQIPTNSVDSLEIDYRESKANNAIRLDLPDRWTPSLARLIGYIVAEGHVVLNDDHTGDVRVTNNGREILDDVEQALENLGLNYTEEKAHKDKRAREVRCNSGEFTSLLANLEPAILQTSAEQRVPEALMAASDSIKREFLKAYIDSEGHVAETQRETSIASASRELLEGVRSLLLSLGIGAQLEERNNGSYRLRISGKDFDRYVDSVGFVTDRKSTVASSYSDIEGNTNTDVIPELAEDLRRIRTKLRLSQSECGLSRSTYQHYERGDRNPSRANLRNVVNAFADRIEDLRALRSRIADGDWSDIKTARDELNISQQSLANGMDVTQTAVSYYERNEVIPDGGEVVDAKQVVFDSLDDALSIESDVSALESLAECDVRWDRIESIELVDPDYDWVYDLEVEDTHSYVSNNVISHNSQLLQYVRNIAPRSVYTSGKGSSAAGLTAAAVRDDFGEGQQWSLEAGALVLADRGIAAIDELDKMRCVTGETLVHTGDGRLSRIRELAREAAESGAIEPLDNGRTIRDVDLTVWTMTEDERLVRRPVSAVHEYDAPETLMEVTLETGEFVTATEDHPFFVRDAGGHRKTRAAELSEGDEIPIPAGDPGTLSDGGMTSSSAASRADIEHQEVTNIRTIASNRQYGDKEKVYDLTVEDTHNFVANGMVVHNSEDRSAMHEGLEQQEISISKAGINATLKSRCSLLGAANPKYGRFDEYEPIAEQIDLEPALVSRFDLIFTVTDKPDAERDKRLAEHILQTNYAGELNTQRTQLEAANVTDEQIDRATESVSPTLDAEFLRKYVAFAKRSCFPTMTEEAKERIRDFYTDLRAKGEGEDNPVPVTARKLEALVRLAEASARVRLSDEVELEDAERVIDVVYASLEDIGVDPETGQYDADVVETGTSKSQRDRIKNLKGLVEDIAADYEEGAPVEEVLDRAEEIGLEPSKAEHEIEKLKQQGELYEPSTDHLRTT